MKNLFLFPPALKTRGLVAALTGLGLLWVSEAEGLINLYRIVLPGYAFPDGSYPYPPEFRTINGALWFFAAGMVATGLLLFLFSREKDEFHYTARLEALQFGLGFGLLGAALLFGYFVVMPGYQLINTTTAVLGTGVSVSGLAYIARYYYLILFAD